MKKNKRLVTVLVLGACVLSVFAVRTLKPHPDQVLKMRNAERSLGDEKAKLWITEYFDYQCPPCAMAGALLERAMKDHPGQIYLQVRYFPLPAHKNALKAALYAECVTRQKGKFWGYHEQVFRSQNEWNQDPYPEIRFAAYADSAGADVKKVEACVQDPATEKTVLDEKAKAQEIGVKMTPSFFVNGKLVVGVKALLDEMDAFFGAQGK